MRITTPADETTRSRRRARHERRDDVAAALGQLDAAHSLAAAALGVEVLELGPLAVAGVGDDQQVDRRRWPRRTRRPRRPARSRMPRTPAALRPIGRTSSSAKRIVIAVLARP